MNKILITGGYSLLGIGLLKTAPLIGSEIYLGIHNKSYISNTTPSVTLNILDKKNVSQIFADIQPDIVIHAAAISDVDYCEKNKQVAKAVNIEGLRNIIDCCIKNKTKIIFISSNAVFDGVKTPKNGYLEINKPNPINYYGQTKYEGEKIVQQSGIPYLITRLITLYGWEPSGCRLNPVTWKLQKLNSNEKLFMVSDRFINPLYNINAAEAIWSAIEKNKTGIYHFAGKNTVSRYDWTLEVAKVFGFSPSLIIPVNSSYFSKLVNRPVNTTFNTVKMEKELGIKPLSVHEGLMQMKKEIMV